MNKLVATSLEGKFHVFDIRTQHPTKGFASVSEKVIQSDIHGREGYEVGLLTFPQLELLCRVCPTSSLVRKQLVAKMDSEKRAVLCFLSAHVKML